MKVCCTCKVELSQDEYHISRTRPDGLQQRCKNCSRTRNKERYHAARANDLKGHREKRRAESRRYLYKIEPKQYAAMLHEQCGVCAICRGTNDDKRELNVDHCHTSGNIRGLLCTKCNFALGYAQDDPDLLRDMADYLEARSDGYD